MKRAVLFLILSLSLALPASALGRYDILLRPGDYDSGDVVVEGYPQAPYNGYKAAGIMAGDKVLEISGRKVGSPRDFNDIMDSLKPGEKVKVRVSRGGKTMDFMMQPTIEDFRFMSSIGKLVTKGKKVKMAVVVVSTYDERDKTGGPGGRAEEARRFWTELPYNVFGEILRRDDYGKYTAFLTLVETDISREVSNIFKDRRSGALTPAERAMIKEKTGATHALTVDYKSTVPEPEKVLNSIDLAIIDLSSGEVAGKAKVETLYDVVTGKELKSTVDGCGKNNI